MLDTSCTIEGCDEPVLVAKRGWCRKHYCRWQRHGDPLGGRHGYGLTPEQRFWLYVDKTDACWLWTGGVHSRKAKNPYGIFSSNGQADGQMLAHRFAYELLVGPIPPGAEIDHLCRQTLCVRPDHLQPVTHIDNVMRGESPSARHRAKTACPQGHPYDSFGRGGFLRFCRQCRNANARAAYARRQAQKLAAHQDSP